MEHNIITINENELTFESGETILEVAQRNQIDIPTLCHLKNTIPTTTCRICLVEIKGYPGLVESCATKAEQDMIIFTESSKVIEARRDNISKLLASGNHNCAIRDFDTTDWTSFQMGVLKNDGKDELCPVWGDCELQNLAYRYQVKTRGMPLNECKYETERANPFIIRDFSRCILCGRCVKACREIQVNNAIEFGYTGEDRKIIAKEDAALKDSNCVFCGECLQVCPVGALIPDKSFRDGRFKDTQKVRTTCSFCGVGCQMDLFVQDNKIVKIDGADIDLPPNNASLCVKGRFGYEFVASSERLTTPLIKKNGKQVQASWDEALDLVAKKLSSIKNEFGPDSIGVLTSARITNEDNYIAHKFTRAVLKTNNIDHCARL
ncbi:MorB: molybdopterin oxidoreductase, 4Fe-4S protein [Desulfobacula toluolica Tol2]|uniref:MorB: molybdopterin oxidoreductase, 4Fe-4S protein n=3 Tax=Desulfobacula toluolica TaxID=28223 RepID=K0NHN2_DESTT|nr:MorB: molybdopterin oxidoreductase, 4Fe-4S protein [Desulfobacula toluolica Tol2]